MADQRGMDHIVNSPRTPFCFDTEMTLRVLPDSTGSETLPCCNFNHWDGHGGESRSRSSMTDRYRPNLPYLDSAYGKAKQLRGNSAADEDSKNQAHSFGQHDVAFARIDRPSRNPYTTFQEL